MQPVIHPNGPRQRRTAAQMIGLQMGVEHAAELPTALAEQSPVDLGVAARVHHQGLAATGDGIAQTAPGRAADLNDGEPGAVNDRPRLVVVAPGHHSAF